MKSRPKKQSGVHRRIDQEVGDYVPNLSAPSAVAALKSEKNLRRWILFIVRVGIPSALFLGVVAVVSVASVTPPVAVGSVEVNNSVGKSAAVSAMDNWLTQKNVQHIPNLRLLSWDGFRVIDPPPVPQGKENDSSYPTFRIELHDFTLVAGATYYNGRVEVRADDVLGAVATGSPTLSPKLTAEGSSLTLTPPWFGYDLYVSEEKVQTAVNQWATAFASGDSKALKFVTGDPSNDRSYLPLFGTSNVTPTIVSAGRVTSGKDAAETTEIIARVSLAITWPSTMLNSQGSPQTPVSTIEYDVLVSGVDSATPRVTSWGGVGDGLTLTPYSAAFEGVQIEKPLSVKPSTNGTPTPDTTAPTGGGDGEN